MFGTKSVSMPSIIPNSPRKEEESTTNSNHFARNIVAESGSKSPTKSAIDTMESATYDSSYGYFSAIILKNLKLLYVIHKKS